MSETLSHEIVTPEEFRVGMVARALDAALKSQRMIGMFEYVQPVEYDGFKGKVIGAYVTVEGRVGYVLQLEDARVVHVYGEKWVKPWPTSSSSDRT